MERPTELSELLAKMFEKANDILQKAVPADYQKTKKKSKAQRMAMARVINKDINRALLDGTVSQEQYEFAKILPPEIDENGQLVLPTYWKVSKQQPRCAYGCERFLQKNTPGFKNKSLKEIRMALITMQSYNDKTLDELKEKIKCEMPKKWVIKNSKN